MLPLLQSAVRPKAGTHGPQVALYDRCLRRWGGAHTFMAFIDTDEFLLLRDGTPTLPALVRPVLHCAHAFLRRDQGTAVRRPALPRLCETSTAPNERTVHLTRRTTS